MARSHVVVGLAAWMAVAPSLHASRTDAINLGLAVLGALAPDIDHPQSWVGRRTRPVSTALAGVLGHRGVTHSAVAIVGLTWLLLHLGYRQAIVTPLAVGYLSHLAADMLTPRGLRLLWPSSRTWGLPLCRTGSPTETLIVLALAGLTVWQWPHPLHLPLPRLWG